MPYKDPVKAKEASKRNKRFYYVRNRNKPEFKAMIRRSQKKWRTKDNPMYMAWRRRSAEMVKLRYFLRYGDRKKIKSHIMVVCLCCGQQYTSPFKKNETQRQALYLPIFLDLLAQSHARTT